MTTIPISMDAPGWASDMARKIGALIDEARLGPFVSFTPYDASGTLPDATRNTNKIILVRNAPSGAPLALSNGTAWIDSTGATL
jgi:hypothetical protein